MSPGPKPARRRTAAAPDVQKLLQARSFAVAAALEWKRLTDRGDLKAARKKAIEAIKWEKQWRKLGGKGPLT